MTPRPAPTPTDAGFPTAVSILVHDLHNAVAIIQQSAGLLGDLAGTAAAEPTVSGADAREIATLVTRHAKRADRLGNALARILRTPIPGGPGCEVNRTLADARELISDGIAARGAETRLQLDRDPLPTAAAPRDLLHLVLTTALLLLEPRTADCRLELRVASKRRRLHLTATGAGRPTTPFTPPRRLAPLLEKLDATLAAAPGTERAAILTLPPLYPSAPPPRRQPFRPG